MQMDPILSYFTYIPVALIKTLRAVVVASEGVVGDRDQPRRRQGNFSTVVNILQLTLEQGGGLGVPTPTQLKIHI